MAAPSLYLPTEARGPDFGFFFTTFFQVFPPSSVFAIAVPVSRFTFAIDCTGVAPLYVHPAVRLCLGEHLGGYLLDRSRGLVIARDRLERAAAFVAQLHRLSAKTPHSWRRAESVGRDVGLAGLPLDQAIRDAEQAGLIERRADDEGLIILTAEGRAAASQ